MTAEPRLIRVASIPASHPYVRHLDPPTGPDRVVRLPDPTDPWWPPSMLTTRWIAEHADAFDLMHVHFGFDAVAPEDLDAVGQLLSQLAKPLVLTVHDLRNPHHPTPDPHDEQLRTLLRHATSVITLTDHARGIIKRRYGRKAEVIPHPHIVELDDLRHRQARPRPASKLVGLHLKSVRPNMDTAVVDAAVEGTRRVPGARLRVDVHLDVALPTGTRHDPALMDRLHRYADDGALSLHPHDCFDDDAFVDYLDSLAVSVLAYRFGTHSGWLEACRDLGVAVVAPDCGSYQGQGDVHAYRCNEYDGLDAESCAAAVERALRAPAPAGLPWRTRADQRFGVAERHRQLYLQAMAPEHRGLVEVAHDARSNPMLPNRATAAKGSPE